MTKPKKYSVMLSGHATSVTLEPEFWKALQRIAYQQDVSIAFLISQIDEERITQKDPPNLSSAIRVFILKNLKESFSTN